MQKQKRYMYIEQKRKKQKGILYTISEETARV